VTPDHCPLCGTSVGLLRRPEHRSATERLRARIATLRDRAGEIARGDVTPRTLKDDALWMCATCRRMIVGAPVLDGQEIQRRIHEEIRSLERHGDNPATRAS